MAEPALNERRAPRKAERAPRTSEVVAQSIRDQIANGELVPGDRFPAEDDLMRVFGIARTTLREALRVLESEGLVEVVRGRMGGPRVTRPNVDHLAKSFAMLLQLDGVKPADVYAARQVIEPELVRSIARGGDPAVIAELNEAVEAAASVVDDGAAFGRAATVVHETIAEHGGNATLATFSRLLHEVVAGFYLRTGGSAPFEDRQRAVRSFRKLVRLVEAGDVDGAEAHWRRQMAYTGQGAAALKSLLG